MAGRGIERFLQALIAMVLFAIVVTVIATGVYKQYVPRFSIGALSAASLTQVQSPEILSAQPDASPTPQTSWQAGALAGPDAHNTSAMRTTIRTVLPAHIADHTTDYFWIGAYLSDGSFIQAGYAVPWYDHQAHWFYCAFTPQGAKGPCGLGAPGSAGPNDGWRHYAITATPGDTDGSWTWTATMDDQIIGVMPEGVGSTGNATPGVYVEQSSFAPLAAVNDLGPVEFAPALEIQTAAQPAWHAPAHAIVMYSAAGTCAAYGVAMAGANDVLLGSGLPCLPAKSVLW